MRVVEPFSIAPPMTAASRAFPVEANQRLTPIQGGEAVVLGDGDDVTARVIPSALRRNTEARFSYPRNLRARPIVWQRAA